MTEISKLIIRCKVGFFVVVVLIGFFLFFFLRYQMANVVSKLLQPLYLNTAKVVDHGLKSVINTS